MAFRFVHCADAHLDSPLRSLALRNRDLADLIGNASRRAFSRVVDVCLEEGVDALMISGDLYDGDQTSMRTALFLGAELRRLDAAGIRAFVIRGNHDHLSRITRELVLPDNTKVFGGRAEAILMEGPGLPVAVHGLSFAQAHATESLLPRYKAPVEGAVNIGLLHTSLDGSAGHDPYAPCKAADLEASGFRYWALGHIHKRATTTGPCTIVMPGMLQGRDINEAGPKSATLVTVADDGSVSAEERLTSCAQFERLHVDVSAARDWRDIAASIGSALGAAREAAVCEHLVARLTLTGTSALSWRMRRDIDLLATEAEAQAGLLGKTWIDKLEVASTPSTAADSTGGPMDELRRSIRDEVSDSVETSAAVIAAIEDMRRQLPAECRGVLGESDEGLRDLAAQLASAGGEEVLARLMPSLEGQT